MDYIILLYALAVVMLRILKLWVALAWTVGLGALFFAGCVLVYLMEGKEPPHEMRREPAHFERIEAERERVLSSGVTRQIVRRVRRYLKTQPPLKGDEYFAVFCTGEGVEVMRRGARLVTFQYMNHTEENGAYVRLHSYEAKYALAQQLAEQAAQLPKVYVDRVRRCKGGAMFAFILDEGFEREEKHG